MGNLVASLIVRLVDQVSGPAGNAAKSLGGIGKSLKDLNKTSGNLGKAANLLGTIADFKGASRDLDRLSLAYKRAQQEARKLASATSDSATAAQKRAMEKAASAADRAKAAFMEQGRVVRALRSDLSMAGVAVGKLASEERRLQAAAAAATAALAKQQKAAIRSENRRAALGVLAGGAGIAAGHQVKTVGRKALTSAAEFDIGVRKQRVFTDISEEEQKSLIRQALRVGQDTPYTNLDVVKAQTKAMQGLPANFSPKLRAEVGEGIIENVKNYAMVMEADLETSAEAIRSYLQQTGKDISTKQKALAEANKATNQLVRMAKLGGMSDEDVQQFMKFAASPGSVAGLSSESLMTLAALARRGGLRGDEAGVAVRSMASKLSSPTQAGLAAMDNAGIRYSSYKTMPNSVNQSGLENHFKRRLGKGFTAETAAAIQRAMSDPANIQDQGRFISEITRAVEGQYGRKTKAGQTRASDLQAIAKTAREFHKTMGGKVDMERLVGDLMSSNLSLDQLNSILTDKHGGKFAVTQRQRDEYNASRKQIADAGNDPDFAKKKADEIYAGLGGALKKFEGSIETFYQQLGTSNESWLKPLITSAGDLVDKFSNLSTTTQQILTAIGLVGGGAAAAGGTLALIRTLVTGGGSAAALTGSAVALDGSAAALTAAAVKLGGAGVVGSAGSAAAGAASKAGWASRLMPWLGRAGWVGAAGYLGYKAINGDIRPPVSEQARTNFSADGAQAQLRKLNDTALSLNPRSQTFSADLAKARSDLEAINRGLAETKARPEQNALSRQLIQRAEGQAATLAKTLEQVEQKAREAGVTIDTSLNVTVTPTVDTSSIDAAKGKADALASTLRSMGAAAGAPGGGIAGKRAGGGPVTGGKTYLVGEKGPELFTPSGSGRIVPNDDLSGSGRRASGSAAQRAGGSSSINVTFGNIVVQGVQSASEFAEQVGEQLEARIREVTRGLQADLGYTS